MIIREIHKTDHDKSCLNHPVCNLISWWIIIISLCCGCSPHPRVRLGAFFGSPLQNKFPDPNSLGRHQYDYPQGEKNGMVYTCRGGFIDIGHLREAADRTAYLADVVYQNLILDKNAFTFHVIEPSHYWVQITYPQGWDQRPYEERCEVSYQVAVRMGQYFAQMSLVWHEILTWYGFSSTGIFPETVSSFSCEDTYSDLLGTTLAVQALSHKEQDYEKTMTRLIDQTLRELEVQPSQVALDTFRKVAEQWCDEKFLFIVKLKKHNIDGGFFDGRITPILVPGVCPDAEPLPLQVPDLSLLTDCGFTMELEIESREFEKDKIYRDLQIEDLNCRLRPAIHFPLIMEEIRKQAKKTDIQ